MNWKSSDKTWIGYGTALLLFVVSFAFTYLQTRNLVVYSNELKQNIRSIRQLNQLLINVRNAENQYRLFILSKQDSVITDIGEKFSTLLPGVDSVKSLLSKESAPDMEELRFLVNDFRTRVLQAAEYYRNNQYRLDNKVLQYSLEVLSKTERIADKIGVVNERETVTLQEHYNSLSASTRSVGYVNVVFFVLGLLLSLYSLFSYLKENRAKLKANRRTQAYAQELEKRVRELAEANQQLNALKSIEKFAATGRIARTIAHEVRNPLTNINLAADQMKHLLADNQEADVLVNMIIRNSNRINQLISDLLSSTKFLELHYEEHSINRLLDETLDMARDRVELQGVRVHKQYDTRDARLLVDGEKIKIAFLNIIVNAIEAMEPGRGVLVVKTEVQPRKCIVSISDNGAGIEPEALNRLFEPYFTSKPRGSGLGLTNTHNIVYTHKGTIEVLSAVGKGTTFIITLQKPE